MIELDDQGRPEPPLTADELGTLVGFLDFQRATLAWKCEGLDSDGLNAQVADSTMTLGGLLKHLSYVEDYWFSERLHGHERGTPWNTVDWEADPDWEWHSAGDDSPEQLWTLWRTTVDRSRELVHDSMANSDGLGQLAKRAWADGRSPSLRWILVHMIEEYSRHNGHADLLRESIDGCTGE